MSDDTFINEVMSRLKDKVFLMIPDDFIEQLIITLHANVNAINTMAKIAELQASSLTTSINELSTRIAEIAFNVEDVRNEQR